MKIVKTLSLIILVISSITSHKNVKTSLNGFYPGATDQQLIKTTTPLINMNDSNAQLLNSCIQSSFADKYEYQERDLWAKIEKVNSNTNLQYKRAFWVDFFANVKDEVKDSTGSQICGVVLTANLKKDADFNDPKLQKQIRDSVADLSSKVASLVADRSKTFITSSVSTHRYSGLVDQQVFNKLNQRANLK